MSLNDCSSALLLLVSVADRIAGLLLYERLYSVSSRISTAGLAHKAYDCFNLLWKTLLATEALQVYR